jgi:hypothetical protein
MIDRMRFKSLLDPKFKYRSAAKTDVRKTFQRIKREQRKAQSQPDAKAAPSSPRERPARR